MKLSISLHKPKIAHKKPPILHESPFGGNAEDEHHDGKAENGPLPHAAHTSKAMQKRMNSEKQVDATVYEYDEVWDKIQEAKQRQQLAKEADAAARKPKYIQGLLATAATRKLDHLRAEDKMMQREREAEGDLYKDKESFVTQAYKEQMEEVRKAEEEEKRREEARKKQGGASIGLTHFYRQLLEEEEQKHQETVAAAEKRIIGPQPGPNLTITKPPDVTRLADADLARLARSEGREVELNDDGQIVDKRELLSAGLNLSLPNTRRLGMSDFAGNTRAVSDKPIDTHRAVGTASSRKEINERRAREIQQQMTAEQQRVEQQMKDDAERAIQRAVAKRNDESDIECARARYLERKRRKMEDAQAQQEGISQHVPEDAGE